MMRRLLLHGTVRQWLVRVHRWSGLAVMACLLVAGATGTWLAFRVELDRLINPHVRVVEPAGARLPYDEIVSRVERRFAGTVVSSVTFQQRPDESVALTLRALWPGAPVVDQVWVNPYTGALLGERDSRHLRFDRRDLDPMILRLHYSLLLGGWGSWIMGLTAFVWLLTNLIGLALSWPKMWRRLRAWLPILSARMTSGVYKANYDLHRAGGIWLLPVLTVLAFTSVALNLPRWVRPAVQLFSPLTATPTGRRVAPKEIAVSFDRANAALAAVLPAARPSNTYRDLGNGRHSIYFQLPGDVNPQGDNFAFVDLRTGAVTALKRPALSTGGDRFMSWLYPLHTGAAFGLPGRVLIAVTGVGIAGLNATGLYVWWTKWRMRRQARSRTRAARRSGRPATMEAA